MKWEEKLKCKHTFAWNESVWESNERGRSWKKLRYNDKGGDGGFEKVFKLIFIE